MSRLNSLASTTSVRSNRPRRSRSRMSCAMGRSISFFRLATVAWPVSSGSPWAHGAYSGLASRRADRGGGGVRERQVERAVLAAEKAGRGERLQLLRLADAFEALADVDERRDRRVLRAEHLGDPRAEVRRGHGLRRDVAG